MFERFDSTTNKEIPNSVRDYVPLGDNTWQRVVVIRIIAYITTVGPFPLEFRLYRGRVVSFSFTVRKLAPADR